MNGLISRTYQWLRRPRSRGQALTEFSILIMSLLIGGVALSTFAPDMLSAFTVYVRGFYVVLGYPIG
jgi:hypothetical protein